MDRLIIDELRNTKALYQQNWDALEQLIAQWTPKAALTGAQIIKLEKKICCLEDEMEAILMERIRDRANAERYDRMIQKREEEIAAAKKQIEELQNISAVLRDRQTKLKRDIGMIDDILAEGAMTEAHLRMLVEKIYVQETDGKLSLDIQIKAPFHTHLDVYEMGRSRSDTVRWILTGIGWRGCSTATGLRGKRLCRAAGLSGMRERVQSHDPLLERQPPRRIRLPGLPTERERLLHLSPHPRRSSG